MKYFRDVIIAVAGILFLAGFSVFKYDGSGPSDLERIFTKDACTDIIVGKNASVDGSVIVGPSWLGLYGSNVSIADGSTVTADDAFISESILDPNATIVEGYPSDAMPQYTLTAEEIADIIEFIKSISE